MRTRIESRGCRIQNPRIKAKVGIKRKAIIILAAAVIAVLVVVLWPGPKEPEYQGKKLSKWFEEYVENSVTNSQKTLEAEDAIRHIGSNAVPVLIEWVKSKPPAAWRRKLLRIVSDRRFIGDPRVISLLRGSSELRVWRATMGFRFIGEQGSSAATELTTLASDPTAPDTAEAAMLSLGPIGPQGIISLSRLITNQTLPSDFRIRAVRVCTLYLGTNRDDKLLAVQAIRPALRDPDFVVRVMATNDLGMFAPEVLEEK